MAKRQKKSALMNEPKSEAKEVVTQFSSQLPVSCKTPSREGLSELDFLLKIHDKLPRDREIRELVTDLLNCELSSDQITRLARIRQVGESFPVAAPIIGAQFETTLSAWLSSLTDLLGSDGLPECRRYQIRVVALRSRIKSDLHKDWSDPEYVKAAWRHSLSLLESSDEFPAPIGHTSKLVASINSGEERKELERLFSDALREAKQQPNGLRQDIEATLRVVRDALCDFAFEALVLAQTGFIHSTTSAAFKHAVVREPEGVTRVTATAKPDAISQKQRRATITKELRKPATRLRLKELLGDALDRLREELTPLLSWSLMSVGQRIHRELGLVCFEIRTARFSGPLKDGRWIKQPNTKQLPKQLPWDEWSHGGMSPEPDCPIVCLVNPSDGSTNTVGVIARENGGADTTDAERNLKTCL